MTDVFLTAAQVRARYNVSEMSLWRWLNDPKSGFPQPTRLGVRRRYWKIADLEAWERKRAAASAKEAA